MELLRGLQARHILIQFEQAQDRDIFDDFESTGHRLARFMMYVQRPLAHVCSGAARVGSRESFIR